MKKHDDDCRCAICQGEGIEAFRKTVLENIRSSGFHMTGVFSESGSPAFTYTAGLETTFNHPEIVIYGIEPRIAGHLLHAAVDVIRDGAAFKAGGRYERIAEKYSMVFLDIRDSLARNKFPVAFQSQPGCEVRVLQMVWPDPNGKFPWQTGYDQRYSSLQPMLLDDCNYNYPPQ